MPDLFELETYDWTLYVWSRDLDKAGQRLKKTLSVRKKKVPQTVLYFEPALAVADEHLNFTEYTGYKVNESPLFFENKLYEFEFQFIDKNRYREGSVKLSHRLREIEDAFRFSARSRSLRGSIDFRNHVGRCHFKLSYHNGHREIKQSIAFDVLPVKMDLDSDLKQIQQSIEEQYPSWLFSLAEKTQQSFGRSAERRKSFPVLWLAHFTALRDELDQCVRHILYSPHARLLKHTRYKTAERLKGKLPHKLEQNISRDHRNGLHHKRYVVHSAKYSVDTPENRFIKNVLIHCNRTLSGFIGRLEKNTTDEKSRLSDSFANELHEWKAPLEKQLSHPFFRDIGEFEGLSSESLVLHQKAGYSGVYRVWQQLRLYLSVLGRQTDISIKPVSELYEIWCFLEVRRILCEQLGFTEKSNKKTKRSLKERDIGLEGEIASTFILERGNVIVRLVHEREFRTPGHKTEGTYSWTTVQKPDILLAAEIDNDHLIYWIFDAKYRIKEGSDGQDYAPDDAINQMHRYRDSLIHLHKKDSVSNKTRPVFGAFALYPGWFNEGDNNPYNTAINEIGIGAFPLLPGRNNSWLKDFLTAQLGEQKTGSGKYITDAPDHYYVQEASRIPCKGMKSSHYDDLVLISTLGPGRSSAYMRGFREGTAEYFHTQLRSSKDNNIEENVMREIRQCVIPVHYAGNEQRQIRYLYDIKSVSLVKRSEISHEKAGANFTARKKDDWYWLFKLGRSYPLNSEVIVGGIRDYKIRLVTFNDLERAKTWEDLPPCYSSVVY